MVDWTKERIGSLTTDKVKILRANAVRRSDNAVATLCDEVIASRAPRRERSAEPKSVPPSHVGEIVGGFHFVCPQEKGVTRNSDGTVWTGTWVVDPQHAERGSKNGAYVALHSTKSELSYLQGTIKDWRKTRREREYAEDRPTRTEFGIDFLLQLTNTPYEWRGDGSGEKGYAWVKQSA
jgi:hypothetical protein